LGRVDPYMKKKPNLYDTAVFTQVVDKRANRPPRKPECRSTKVEPARKTTWVLVEAITEYCKLCMENFAKRPNET